MATWQFSVVLIPASWAEEHSYSSSALYDDEGYDTECAWKGRQPDSNFKESLGEILPPSKSCHDELLTWGNEKESDIQVWIENEIIDGIHIRLDLNQNLNDLIIMVVKVAKSLNCALFFNELDAARINLTHKRRYRELFSCNWDEFRGQTVRLILFFKLAILIR